MQSIPQLVCIIWHYFSGASVNWPLALISSHLLYSIQWSSLASCRQQNKKEGYPIMKSIFETVGYDGLSVEFSPLIPNLFSCVSSQSYGITGLFTLTGLFHPIRNLLTRIMCHTQVPISIAIYLGFPVIAAIPSFCQSSQFSTIHYP